MAKSKRSFKKLLAEAQFNLQVLAQENDLEGFFIESFRHGVPIASSIGELLEKDKLAQGKKGIMRLAMRIWSVDAPNGFNYELALDNDLCLVPCTLAHNGQPAAKDGLWLMLWQENKKEAGLFLSILETLVDLRSATTYLRRHARIWESSFEFA